MKSFTKEQNAAIHKNLSQKKSCSYRTHKAGVVPCVAKSLNKLVPSLHWEITAMALGTKECNVICKK